MIRIKAYQAYAHFRERTGFLSKRTFEFPPYSTVIGMIHSVCGWKEPHRMKVSIACQGIYNESTLRRNWTGGHVTSTPNKEFYDRYNTVVDAGDGVHKVGWVNGVMKENFLSDVNYIFHIESEFEDEILKGLNNPKVYPALGRRGDLLRIDEIKKLSEVNDAAVEKKWVYPLLIPIDLLTSDLEYATIYNVEYMYERYVKGKNIDRREFEEVECVFAYPNSIDANLQYDEDGYPIALC